MLIRIPGFSKSPLLQIFVIFIGIGIFTVTDRMYGLYSPIFAFVRILHIYFSRIPVITISRSCRGQNSRLPGRAVPGLNGFMIC